MNLKTLDSSLTLPPKIPKKIFQTQTQDIVVSIQEVKMRGSILAYQDHKGLVSGHDGNRYEFTRINWSGSTEPAVGMDIDFVAEGSQATNIFPIGMPAKQSKVVLALICWFFGVLGVHRFMVGKVGTGIVMLILTISVFGIIVSGIWVLIDFVVILMGNFTDKNGNRITGEAI